MKPFYFILIIMLLHFSFSFAQNEVDALRYSLFEPIGTAKSVSMGGAIGALGGDISVMATNPAGIGVYRKGDFVISSVWNAQHVSSEYFGTKSTNYSIGFKPSNLGFVTTFKPSGDTPWKFVNIGFSYNQLMDFQTEIFIQGQNPNSSLLHYETLKLNNGIQSADESAYFLAGTVFFNSENNQYVNDYQYNNSYGNYQSHQFKSTGSAGEYDMAIAANYEDRLYIGATIGIQRIRYDQLIIHEENPTDVIPLVYFKSEDNLKATAQGYTLKFGIIYKINQMFRIGGAFHTPAVFNIRDDYWTDVYATIDEGSVKDYTGKSPFGNFLWDFTSPLRFIGNTALVFGKRGTLSAEYEFTDYSTMRISSNHYSFSDANTRIDTIYKGAHSLKVGGEFLIGAIGVRAGFQYLGSPFHEKVQNQYKQRLVYSGGIGITGKQIYFDFAYQYSTQEAAYYLFNWEGSNAELKKNNSKYIATIGFRF